MYTVRGGGGEGRVKFCLLPYVRPYKKLRTVGGGGGGGGPVRSGQVKNGLNAAYVLYGCPLHRK